MSENIRGGRCAANCSYGICNNSSKNSSFAADCRCVKFVAAADNAGYWVRVGGDIDINYRVYGDIL